MSHRIFRLDQVTQLKKQDFLELWNAERSGEEILLGLVQLVLDLLKTTCIDSDSNDDFTLPTNIEAMDLKEFMITIIENKNFNADTQKLHQTMLARFFEMCVQHSENVDWMQPMLSACLCILFEYNETSLLVAKTMVHLYFHVVMKWHNQNKRTAFWRTLGRIREHIHQCIVGIHVDLDTIKEISTTFFQLLNANPEVIPYDNQGIGEIIGKFLLVDSLNVNLKVLAEMLSFGEKHPVEHGENLLRLCANQITNGMILIVCKTQSVRTQRLALKLAYNIQCLFPNRLYHDGFFKCCLLSDDEYIRDIVVKLYRVSFRAPGADTATPQAILCHSIQLYRDYRENYTTCAKRLTSALYDEFTNWPAVFDVITQHITDKEFIDKMFHLLKFVYNHIQSAAMPNDSDGTEELLRTHAQYAIHCLSQLDRKSVHVDTIDHLILAILHTDKELKLVHYSDCVKLADIITAMSDEVNADRIYASHMNMMLVMKCLIQKQYIANSILHARIEKCIAQRSQQSQRLIRRNTNFEADKNILYTAMMLNVFMEHEMITDENVIRQLCIECDALLMANPLDVTYNHKFLGYTILTLVGTQIWAYKKAGNQARPLTDSVSSPSRIADRLLEILQRTPENIDFLIQSVIWALSLLELYFLAVSEKKALDAMTHCVLQKVNLVEITAATARTPRDINLVQLKYVEYMLVHIELLLKAKRPMKVCEIIVALYMKFPDFHLALNLMRYSIEAQLFPMLTDAILDILKMLPKKTEKKKFIEEISTILESMPNISHIRNEIEKIGINVPTNLN